MTLLAVSHFFISVKQKHVVFCNLKDYHWYLTAKFGCLKWRKPDWVGRPFQPFGSPKGTFCTLPIIALRHWRLYDTIQLFCEKENLLDSHIALLPCGREWRKHSDELCDHRARFGSATSFPKAGQTKRVKVWGKVQESSTSPQKGKRQRWVVVAECACIHQQRVLFLRLCFQDLEYLLQRWQFQLGVALWVGGQKFWNSP